VPSNRDTFSRGQAVTAIVKSKIELLCSKELGIGNYTGPAQSIPTQNISMRFILIALSHVRLYHLNIIFMLSD
jgi:hypothetical protein